MVLPSGNRFHFNIFRDINKVKKILLFLLLVVLSVPTLLFFAVNSEKVQNMVAQRVTLLLSEELGNRISVRDIRVSWFNRVTVHDLCVTDLRGDTILRAPEVIGRLNLFAFSSRRIKIRKAVLNEADIRFYMDPEADEINIRFIVDKLKSGDTVTNKAPWVFGIQSVELNNCHFSFKDSRKTFDRPSGMNYADIDVTNLNMVISGFRPGSDGMGGVNFRIRKLACAEQCGLVLNFLSADFSVNRNTLSFKNAHIITPASEIKARDASFHFDSFQNFGGDNFASEVTMSMDIVSSEVTFDDLSHFAPYFRTYPGSARARGKVTGTVENMKGEKLAVDFGSSTCIKGDFNLKGLPNLRSTLIFADITDLRTSLSDIELIQLPKSHTGHVNLPGTMRQLTTIGFKGNFTGFFDDFVTYGTFSTNLGNLSTDVSIKPMMSSADTTFTFHGQLKTEDFDLGKLLVQPSIGKVTMSGMVDGAASGRGNVYAMIEGKIGSIGLKGYNYRNITINGAINNRMYDGKLSIAEPNIKMDFSGKVDLTHPIPAYDFWANVERARLYELRLVEKDTSSFVSFNIKATFSGTNIDNLAGDLELKNSLLRRNSREIEINNLLLFTKAIRDTNRFILRSDILDAEISGQYQFLKLPESFISLAKNYAPAWVSTPVNPDSLSQNNFKFEAEFKDTEKLTNFFINEFRVWRGTSLKGAYNPSQKNVYFVLNVPFMNLNGKQWRGFYVNGSIEDSVVVVESGCQLFRVNNTLTFEHPTLLANVRGDSVDLNLRWNNWDTLLNRGSLNSKIFFLKNPGQQIPLMRISSSPGRIIVANDAWTLTHKGISIDSSAVHVRQLRLSKENQEILVSGTVSRREEDNLAINVKDLDLSVLNDALQFDKLLFGGVANGSASLSNLYHVPVFVSDLHINDLSLNNSLFGSTELTASWNSFNRSVRIEMESILNDLRTLMVKGNYFIANQALNFDAHLEKVPAKTLQPYVEHIFTGLEGTLSSRMKLTGNLANPLLNGEIELRRAALTLDYTKTRYNFSGTTEVKDNDILFKNLEIFDRHSNPSKANGYISLANFKDISFDMRFGANNFEVLDTEERDNSMFYGKAFASGNIRVSGNPGNLALDITARTEKNTQFHIPLSSNDEVSKTTFITFVDHTPRSQKRPLELRRRRNTASIDEPEQEMKFDVKIALDITPDAEAQLIFDSKIGDIIRARGNGNLRLNVANNKFEMLGTYIIDEGDYLFTLRNMLVNKKFTIEKGGIITWNGDPMGALLNLKAIYYAKPSLYDLMGEGDKSDNFRRSVPVECILHISNRLTNPNIRFELQMPNAEQEIRSFLSAATNSEEEMTRQFLSLLVMNRFYPDPNQSTIGGSSGSGLETMGLATASEFLTSQLSLMASQWSDAFDVDFSYRPGTEMTGQNFGMDFSTNTWRVHFDYEIGGAAAENQNNQVGDFTFDMKVGKSDKLRFKVFYRANERYFESNPYTQGIGFAYREDFNRLKDMFKRKSKAIRREEEEAEPAKDENPDNNTGETTKPATAAINGI